jgi:hypothetical protein
LPKNRFFLRNSFLHPQRSWANSLTSFPLFNCQTRGLVPIDGII